MIGQLKLLNRIDNFTWTTFPSSVIFEGDFGCGKHLLCTYLSEKFNVALQDISLNITSDFILNCYINSLPMLYMIDINKIMSSKNNVVVQNALLKFIEEPPQEAKICILCEHKSQLLPTIQNRCQLFVFEKYSIEELESFAEVDLLPELYYIYNTPGKILSVHDVTVVTDIIQLVDNIIENIHKASVPNILTIINKLDLGTGSGYDINVFISFMKYQLINKLKLRSDDKYIKYYKLTKRLSEQLLLLNVNKQLLIENYLLELKSAL